MLILANSTQADELAKGLSSQDNEAHEPHDSPRTEHVGHDVPPTRASDTIRVRMLPSLPPACMPSHVRSSCFSSEALFLRAPNAATDLSKRALHFPGHRHALQRHGLPRLLGQDHVETAEGEEALQVSEGLADVHPGKLLGGVRTRRRRRTDDQHHPLRSPRRRHRRQGRWDGRLGGPGAGAQRGGVGTEGTDRFGGRPRVLLVQQERRSRAPPEHAHHLSRLKVGDDLVGIDLRGNSSPACPVAPPTTYVNEAGATVGYVAVGTGIPHIADLPPLPQFVTVGRVFTARLLDMCGIHD
jgi:hypothetical protein